MLATGCSSGSGDSRGGPVSGDAGADAATPTSRARFEPAPCPTPVPAGLEDGRNVRCGSLIVPESRAAADGRMLSLFVMIVRPEGAPKPDPIVHLIGGPGGSTEAYATVLGGDFGVGTATRTGRELILFDQRGAGRSQPTLRCRSTEAADACFQRLAKDADLAAYNSEESAADVEDLRIALGYEQVNLYGQSYGTALAQSVMRLYPAGIRSAVLEAVSAIPHDAYLTNSAKALELALGRVIADCAADTACNAAFPNPAADLEAVLARSAGDPLTSRSIVEQLVGLTQFAQGTSYVPLALRALAANDAATLAGIETVLGQYEALAENVQRGFSVGTYLTMSCYDYGPLWTKERDNAVNGSAPPAFREALADTTVELCPLLPPSRVSDAQRLPFTSPIPTLLLGGAHDSNTPIEIATALAPSLPRSQAVTVPGWGHTILALGEPCSARVFAAFVEEPSRAVDTSCLKKTVFPTAVR